MVMSVRKIATDDLPSDLQAKADQLLELTQAMLANATSNAWGEFEQQEQQRRVLLETIGGSQNNEIAATFYLAEVIENIQLIDKTICGLITESRDQAADQLRQLRRSQVSNKAYQIVAEDPL